MSEIVNLRQARKRRARDEKRRKGDANAAKHGRKKAESARVEALAELDRRRLDGHRREDRPGAGDPGAGEPA